MATLYPVLFGFNYSGETSAWIVPESEIPLQDPTKYYRYTDEPLDDSHELTALKLNCIKFLSYIPFALTYHTIKFLIENRKVLWNNKGENTKESLLSTGERIAFVVRAIFTALGAGIIFLPIDLLVTLGKGVAVLVLSNRSKSLFSN